MSRTLTTLALCIALPSLGLPGLTAAQQGAPGGHFFENWDLDTDGIVTVAEAQERRGDVFLSFDSNDDGYIDAEEYTYFDEARANDMRENADGGGKGEKRAQKGMTLAFNDVDGDGKVSQQEFLSRAADWLALIDRNGDGAVTSADFGRGKG